MLHRPISLEPLVVFARILVPGMALVVCLAASVACRPRSDEEISNAVTGSPEPSPTRSASSSFFDLYPVKGYTLAEAERVAGFHIPRPSPVYQVAFATSETHLQWFPGRTRPVSKTEYWVPNTNRSSIGVSVGPSYYWGGDSTWTNGEATTVAGKDGWLIEKGSGLHFAYRCGSVDEATLWCVVRIPNTAADHLAAFVGSLQ